MLPPQCAASWTCNPSGRLREQTTPVLRGGGRGQCLLLARTGPAGSVCQAGVAASPLRKQIISSSAATSALHPTRPESACARPSRRWCGVALFDFDNNPLFVLGFCKNIDEARSTFVVREAFFLIDQDHAISVQPGFLPSQFLISFSVRMLIWNPPMNSGCSCRRLPHSPHLLRRM
jgi:hypothetical protein